MRYIRRFLQVRTLREGQRGFTLVELLVVVAILGVLAAIAIPNVSRFASSGQEEGRNAEAQNVQTATDAWMTENKVGSLVGSIAGSAPVTDLTGIGALAAADNDLYPMYIRQATASDGVGYCWVTNGEVTQKLTSETC